MKPSSTAAAVGLGLLLLAWLAAAVGDPPRPRQAPARGQTADALQVETLRADMERQSARLRTRLSASPEAGVPARNPFTFEHRPGAAPRRAAAEPVPAAAPDPPEPAEPALALIGIAERASAEGLTRTAILAGDGDTLHLVIEGQAILGLYRVKSVTVEAVELERLDSGAVRRLFLQIP